MISFWRWLYKGSGAGPGIRRVFNLWLFVHLSIGCTLALLVPISLEKAAGELLLPLVGILIGLSFAWGGNAQALLQTEEINQMMRQRQGGFYEYLYAYQLAIFLILLSLGLWVVAGLGIFDQVWPINTESLSYKLFAASLYALASLTMRSCWHIVLGSQMMLAARLTIKNHTKS